MIKKIKLFIKENWKFLITLLVIYFVMTYELPYVIYTPGGAINMSERVNGDNTYKEKGSISMTYVSMVKGTLPFLGLSYILPNWDIVKTSDITYDNDNLSETVAIDKIYMHEAISNAQNVAFTKAGIDFTVDDTKTTVTYVSEKSKTSLKYGDILLSFDDKKVDDVKSLQEYISNKKVGDFIKVKYERNNKELTEDVELIDMDGSPKLGISFAVISDYTTKYNIEVATKSSESGPSGGLMTTLEIYNKITKEDITKGLTIMGTGTIDKDGTVGQIGGVKYKLIGAVKSHAEVFICPEENYADAKKTAEDNNYDIKIISAKTFDEALEKLSNL